MARILLGVSLFVTTAFTQVIATAQSDGYGSYSGNTPEYEVCERKDNDDQIIGGLLGGVLGGVVGNEISGGGGGAAIGALGGAAVGAKIGDKNCDEYNERRPSSRTKEHSRTQTLNETDKRDHSSDHSNYDNDRQVTYENGYVRVYDPQTDTVTRYREEDYNRYYR